MNVRRMTSGDADEVAALCEQLGEPASPPRIAHRLGLITERRDHAAFVVEDEDERVAGWVHVYGQFPLAEDAYAEIGGLVVEQRQRGHGAGRLLIAAAEAWARDTGYDELRVAAHTARESAHDFFERLGYSRTAATVHFVKPL
jgi:GNAT superfamily N-acetyltransferase